MDGMETSLSEDVERDLVAQRKGLTLSALCAIIIISKYPAEYPKRMEGMEASLSDEDVARGLAAQRKSLSVLGTTIIVSKYFAEYTSLQRIFKSIVVSETNLKSNF